MLLFEGYQNENDIVYTPDRISKFIIDFISPVGKILDPCRGDGAFFKYLPEGSDYCEIREGKDFFDYNEKVDWIIGNPPYSIFEDFLKKSFEISSYVSFLVPLNKIFQRQKIMNMINQFGKIETVIVFGSGHLLDFPFGFAVGNFIFRKGFNGNAKILLGMEQVVRYKKKEA